MKVYTFGHSARSLEEFKSPMDLLEIDILVDLRKKPQSRYYPHFNRQNLEEVFKEKYIFGGEFLGGSPEFHNDLLEYIQNHGINKSNSANRLFSFIDEETRERIFSNEVEFSNNEKRKFWITQNFLNKYIPVESRKRAEFFLEKLFKKFPNKKICFFCSEKEPTHCHRYHLLEKSWLKGFPDISVEHIEDLIENQKPSPQEQPSLFK